MSDPGSLLVLADTTSDKAVALRRGFELAALTGASVHVAALIHDRGVDNRVLHDKHQRRELRQALVGHHRETLDRQLASLAAGVSVTREVVWTSKAADWVQKRLAKAPAAMVIKAADGKGTRQRSLADWALLRHCPAPVLLAVQTRWPKHPVVLACVDLSSAKTAQQRLNTRVLQRAAYLARQFDGELHLVHTIEVSTVLADLDLVHRDEVERQARKDLAGPVKALREEWQIKARNVHLPVGNVAHGINSVADRIKSRLMVIGTSARSGVRGLVIGNTAEQVLEHANTDILTLKN